MLSLWANWLVTKFGLNSLKRYLWPVLYMFSRFVFSFCKAILWLGLLFLNFYTSIGIYRQSGAQ